MSLLLDAQTRLELIGWPRTSGAHLILCGKQKSIRYVEDELKRWIARCIHDELMARGVAIDTAFGVEAVDGCALRIVAWWEPKPEEGSEAVSYDAGGRPGF